MIIAERPRRAPADEERLARERRCQKVMMRKYPELAEYPESRVAFLLRLLDAEWQPIETAPIGVIQRWHRIWNCPVAVERNNGRFPGRAEWITATKDQSWPEGSFTPHWRPLPVPPQ